MKQNKIVSYTYRISLLMLALTGFGQMPIFKRYYIADIPGLAWLAEFYTTHLLHYMFAALFTAIVFYTLVVHIAEVKQGRETKKGSWFRGGIIFGISVSGFLLVIKNFPGTWFGDGFITATNIVHLVLAMIFLFFSLGVLLFKKKEYI